MNSRANLLIDGPFALLRQLVSLYKKGSGPDSRAQVTIHSKSGKIWTGVPVSFSEDKSRSFLVLEVQPKNSTVIIDTLEIQAVEIENLEIIHSLIDKPWFSDPGFKSISRLQLQRELGTIWKSYPNQKLLVAIESFPNNDEVPGILFSWLKLLKSEIDLIANTELGQSALSAIEQITIELGSDSLFCKKENKSLSFKVSLSKESFNNAEIAKLLNNNL